MKALKALRQKFSSKTAQKAKPSKVVAQKAQKAPAPKAAKAPAKSAKTQPAKAAAAKSAPVKNAALKNGKAPAKALPKTSVKSVPAPKVGAKVADKNSMGNGTSNTAKNAKAAGAGAAQKTAKATGKGGNGLANGLSLSKRNPEILEAVCREVACEGLSTTAGYCRLHYIKNWKKIKRKESILKEGKLNQYIEELVIKYPDKYIEAIRLDLAGDKEFAKVIYDLDLDESPDEFVEDAESSDGIIDSIKREFDDEGETF